MKEKLQKLMADALEAGQRAAERAEFLGEVGSVASRESLVDMVSRQLKNRQLVLVSNREPYSHVLKDGKPSWFRSAGGLTIALDSVAQACGSVWVCHGGADADFMVTDSAGMVGVPPDAPRYALKRISMTQEEEKGFYEGFSNESLWPLCHVCYVRPAFRAGDWEMYQRVNQKFAEAVAEVAQPGAVVFLQDYHLCLAGQYLKAIRPDITSMLFWHIPWPNPEIFRICPWKQELLRGLLANDILGFHLHYHATNFVETVRAELECHVDPEHRIITQGGQSTRVRAYPISVDLKAIDSQARSPAVDKAAKALAAQHRLEGLKVGLGVDRLDYTKGIPERLEALDQLFQRHPEQVGRFTFVQIGVPSRTNLEDYRDVVQTIAERCDQLNARWGTPVWKPTIFLKGHQDFNALLPWYRLADVCVVSSLHDGMNLVAKEFVAASPEGRGVLVLSRFTGAWRELEQAIPVNPYDSVGMAEAFNTALEMSAQDQTQRMERMRRTVAANNIYTWAQAILGDVIQLAQDQGLAGG